MKLISVVLLLLIASTGCTAGPKTAEQNVSSPETANATTNTTTSPTDTIASPTDAAPSTTEEAPQTPPSDETKLLEESGY